AAIRAALADAIFKGARVQLLFAAPEGAEVQVEASSLPAGAAPGALLDLTWAVDDTLVYPAAEAGPQDLEAAA
ncbi:hypothetical protein C2U72_23390, partial [Prosthecomicrobium hirschii]